MSRLPDAAIGAAGAELDDPEPLEARTGSGEPAAPAAAAAGMPGAARRSPARVRTTRRLALAAVVIAAAIGFLLYKGLTSAVVYFKTASEAVADRAQLGTSTFQLEGVVAKGSVHQLGGGRVAFMLTGGSARIDVVNTGAPPQLFRAGVPVVVVGHFTGTGNDFASDEILVKHSNEYIAAHPDRVTVPTTTP